jgi:hypothetical protein
MQLAQGQQLSWGAAGYNERCQLLGVELLRVSRAL